MKELNSAFSNSVVTLSGRQNTSTIWVGWEPPQLGWYKLNTDDCWKREIKSARGGTVRDWQGKWVGGFSVKLGSCIDVGPELWAAIYGLQYE